MKKIVKKLMILSLAAFVCIACTKSTEFDNGNALAVSNLLYPTDNSTVELYKFSAAKTNFEWKKSEGTQLYSVIFYSSDKKSEIGRYMSDNNGINNSLQISHQELSLLAERADIAAGKSGSIYWNVITSGGVKSVISTKQSKLTLTRYKSALEKPYRLFITGTGSEGGEDFTKALQMKSKDEAFEIYTRINGAISFVNNVTDGNKMNVGFDENGEFTYGADASGSVEPGVYRITVDFLSSKVNFEKITAVSKIRANGVKTCDLTYQGNGAWKSDEKVMIGQFNESRYRFIATVDGKSEVWGSARTDKDAAVPTTVIAQDPYYSIYVNNATAVINDTYTRCYKLLGRLDKVESFVYLYMQPDRFYHKFDFEFSLTDVPIVTTMTTPLNESKLLLSSVDNASTEFKWDAPAPSTQLKITSYNVVFSTDAACAKIIDTYSAGWNTNVKIPHTKLDAIAEAAGIASGTSGVLYWGVQTSLEGNTAISTTINKITIRRILSAPTHVYITGDGSEFGTSYGQMNTITDEGKDKGKLEIYVQMTKNGQFDITTSKDPSSDAYTKFQIKSLTSGGKIEENSTATNTFTKDDGVYRLVIDFIADTIGLKKVSNVQFAPVNMRNNPYSLIYQGNGVWKKENFAADFKTNGSDNRFFFYAECDGVKTKIGANVQNSPAIGGTTQLEPGDPKYWAYWTGEMSDYDYSLRTMGLYWGQNTRKMDVELHMNGNSSCNHSFVYIKFIDNQ